jgi:4-hydroxy-2-oxoheptanedioate aldolase
MIMIEKKPAVDQLEAILSVKGVDMIQWGPSDYSMSVGMAGKKGSPEIKAVERKVFETALKMGVQPRAEIGSPDQAKYYLDLGVRHFSIGVDVSILYQWWRQNGEEMRKALEGK